MSEKEDRMELSVFSCWTAKLLLRAKIESVNVDKHGKFITIDINDDETAEPFFALEASGLKSVRAEIEMFASFQGTVSKDSVLAVIDAALLKAGADPKITKRL